VAAEVCQQLNQQFHNGRPSSRLASAGVLLHVFSSAFSSALRGTEVIEPLRAISGIISSSIISNAYGAVFSPPGFPEPEGVVLQASVNISCFWSVDGGTRLRKCGRGTSSACVAGCGDPPQWCKQHNHTATGGYCPWRPTELKQMLIEHVRIFRLFPTSTPMTSKFHNEVVVHAESEYLPVEAVFSTRRVPSNRTVRIHRLLAASGKKDFPPLLHLSLKDQQNPFKMFAGGRN